MENRKYQNVAKCLKKIKRLFSTFNCLNLWFKELDLSLYKKYMMYKILNEIKNKFKYLFLHKFFADFFLKKPLELFYVYIHYVTKKRMEYKY